MEQNSQPHNDEQGEWATGANPEWDNSANPTDAAPEDGPKTAAGREMLVQLQQMIDNVATQAGPVLRDVAAKAAELAAVAGQKAGPLAYKAAEVTENLGQKVSARSKDFAAEMRRAPDDAAPSDAPADAQGPTTEGQAPEGGLDSSSDDKPATDSSTWG